jgi:ketosteroid isomerase-like protein
MADSNVDRFTDAVTAFNDRDGERLMQLLDPAVDWHPQQAAVDGGFKGHEGVAAWVMDLSEVYEEGQLDITSVRDFGDQVLGCGRLHIVGKGSGISTDFPVAIVAEFRDGLVTHLKDYGDEREARAALRAKRI